MRRSVLVVDDSARVRKAVRGFFDASAGWTTVGEARDGAEAVQKAIDLRPDLIIMDFSMPNMNGVEAASVIKNKIPEVHIVVFTIFDDAFGPRLNSAVGIDLVVSKAEGLTSLVKSVRHFIGTTGLLESIDKTEHRQPRAPN